MEIARALGRKIPFASHLGVRLVEQGGGRAVLEAELVPELLNSFGSAHGGVIMTLLDIAMAVAARTSARGKRATRAARRSPARAARSWCGARAAARTIRCPRAARRRHDRLFGLPGDAPGRGGAPLRRRRARALHARSRRGFSRRASRRAVQGRAIEPNVPARRGRWEDLRHAAQAARKAAALRARGRSRVSRRHGARADRLSRRAHLRAIHRRERDRRGVLHHGLRRGARAVGSAAAGDGADGARCDLRRDESRHRDAPPCRLRRDRPRRLRQAGQLFPAPDRPLGPPVQGLRDRAHRGDASTT